MRSLYTLLVGKKEPFQVVSKTDYNKYQEEFSDVTTNMMKTVRNAKLIWKLRGGVRISIRIKLERISKSKKLLVLLFIILLLLTSIAYSAYYFPEKHIENSTQNINDLRETTGLSINSVLWDEKGDRLILSLSDDISVVDDDFNYFTQTDRFNS